MLLQLPSVCVCGFGARVSLHIAGDCSMICEGTFSLGISEQMLEPNPQAWCAVSRDVMFEGLAIASMCCTSATSTQSDSQGRKLPKRVCAPSSIIYTSTLAQHYVSGHASWSASEGDMSQHQQSSQDLMIAHLMQHRNCIV